MSNDRNPYNETLPSVVVKGSEPVFLLTPILAGVVAALISGVIVNIALPQIAFEYHLPQPIIQWLSSSYLCASAIGMLLSGRIVSHYGIKTTTIFAMLILTWGSSLGGGGESFNSLIVARIIQGLAAGFVTPVAMTAVSLFIPSNKQGFAFGISGLILVLSPGIGLFLGGQIVEALKWNYVFFAPIPICFISISLAIFYLPSDKEILRNTFHNCFLMLMVFLAGFSVFITSYNGTPLLVLLSASPGVALILGLYFNRSPVQDTGIARKIPGGDFFYSSMAIMFIVGCGIYGSYYIIPIYLQLAQNLSPVIAGKLMLYSNIPAIFTFPLAGYFSDKCSDKTLIAAGIALFAISSLALVYIPAKASFAALLMCITLSRIGTSMIAPSLSKRAFVGVNQGDIADISGLLNFVRIIGGTAGVTFIAQLWDWGLHTENKAMYSARCGFAGGSESQHTYSVCYQIYERSADFVFFALFMLFVISLVPLFLQKCKSISASARASSKDLHL